VRNPGEHLLPPKVSGRSGWTIRNSVAVLHRTEDAIAHLSRRRRWPWRSWPRPKRVGRAGRIPSNGAATRGSRPSALVPAEAFLHLRGGQRCLLFRSAPRWNRRRPVMVTDERLDVAPCSSELSAPSRSAAGHHGVDVVQCWRVALAQQRKHRLRIDSAWSCERRSPC